MNRSKFFGFVPTGKLYHSTKLLEWLFCIPLLMYVLYKLSGNLMYLWISAIYLPIYFIFLSLWSVFTGYCINLSPTTALPTIKYYDTSKSGLVSRFLFAVAYLATGIFFIYLLVNHTVI